ncbi:MAG: metallophosphoesterase family protein, partial [Proteobacteria bacterium]|nr:metallophosphoesterase family protein [Pseudomonadota bacterium]
NRIFDLYKGVNLILHAGDIGEEDVLTQLETIAKTTAVYGNTDSLKIRSKIPKEVTLIVEGLKIHLSHNEIISKRDFDIIVQGHTHLPESFYEGKNLFINPGAANPNNSIPAGQASVVILELKEKEIISSTILFF